ncbi:MAG: branched-chain amino acid ABC transporter permease [Actinobacteria bacterium]|nr:branched-chain amino acid ABC transporter permease [Actinomycetota bacterium]MBW3642714.1 branched-chain amino acid ABC transporter permease [Actinomycetota bacterium]
MADQFGPQTVDGLTLGSIYALIALGYTLVYGVLRLINFAHSEIFMVGIFASLFALHGLGVQPGDPTLSGAALMGTLLVVTLVAMAASGLTAVAMERIAYRPLRRRGAPRLAALITAIGVSLFLQELFAARYGRDELGFPRVLEKRQLLEIAGANVRSDKVLVVVAALLLMVALDRFVNRSRLGRGIRATAQDAETAALMGVDINRVVMLTFLLGGLLAGAAGTLYGVFFEAARYNIGFLPGIKAFTAAVLGGIGNIRGALVGGLSLGLLENWGSTVLGGEWKDVFAFSVLVLVLLFRPTGLLGESLGKARA